MVGGLDKQIKEIKEVIELPVKHPELFEALGIAQPKVRDSRHTKTDPQTCHLSVGEKVKYSVRLYSIPMDIP